MLTDPVMFGKSQISHQEKNYFDSFETEILPSVWLLVLDALECQLAGSWSKFIIFLHCLAPNPPPEILIYKQGWERDERG